FSLTDTIECNSPPTSNKSITITTDNPIEKDLLTHNFPRRISSSKFPINRFKIKKIPPKMAFPSNNESKFLDGSKKYTKIKINNISSNKILNDINICFLFLKNIDLHIKIMIAKRLYIKVITNMI